MLAMKTLSTISEVIEAFGGHAELARWCGYEQPSGVANWLSRGIPPAYHMRLSLEAKRRGFLLDPESVFGLEEPDAVMFRDVFSPSSHQAA